MGQIVFHLVIIIIDRCPCDVYEHLSPEAFDGVCGTDKGHDPAMEQKSVIPGELDWLCEYDHEDVAAFFFPFYFSTRIS